jgi:hypothetical protein
VTDAGESHLRASDAERDRVVELLSEHASTGRLTLSELEERAEQAYAAKTHAELEVLVRDLPGEVVQPTRRRTIRRWFVAIMGGSDHKGRYRLSGSVTSISIMGGDNIDLRDAEIDGDEVTINAVAVMGGSEIFVPDSVEVEVNGFSLMGGDEQRGSRRKPRPGAPVIRIRTFNLMGGAAVWRLPAETRDMSLKEAKKFAKAIEKGQQPPQISA